MEQLETSIQGDFGTVCRWCDGASGKCGNESEWDEEENRQIGHEYTLGKDTPDGQYKLRWLQND